jgi:preprotein translocase subunit SecE
MATTAQARTETMADGNSFLERVGQWPAQVKNYIDDLRQEMRRVTWPNSKQVRATTAVVIGTVFVFAAYFAVVDFLVGRGITRLFNFLGK